MSRRVLFTCSLSWMALACAASGRPADSAPAEMSASGEDRRPDAETETPPGGGAAWRPATPPAPMPPWPFRIALYNADRSIGAYLEVDEASHFYDYVVGSPRPTEYRVRFDSDYALRNVDDGRVYFELRASDGALVETVDTGYVTQDLRCHLTERAELRCHHDDGENDFVLSVRGDHIVGRVVGAAHDDEDVEEMNLIEPAPTNDDQKRRVLFIWASYLIPTDTGSHDGDACCMDVGN